MVFRGMGYVGLRSQSIELGVVCRGIGAGYKVWSQSIGLGVVYRGMGVERRGGTRHCDQR